MIISRILYLTYYIKKLDKEKLTLFLNYAANRTGKSKRSLFFDSVISVFRYNTAIIDYFQFRFFEKNKIDRLSWAGTGYLYEYQLKMNPKSSRIILEDKIEFLNSYRPFIKRHYADMQALRSDPHVLHNLINNKSGKLVLKGSKGQVGAEVEVISSENITQHNLLKYMTENGYDLIEEYVVQHTSLMALSPSGLNTVRIFTQLNGDNVDILGARLRISVNSHVDNMGAGNLAASVDLNSGVVNGKGVYSDITKEDQTNHPVTGMAITGFSIPHWKEVLDLAKRVSLHRPENRSVGWDIAITEAGPDIIEGNHNWCKLLWQLPVKKGLKSELEHYL